MGLSEAQITHALGDCDCSADIRDANDLYWGLIELNYMGIDGTPPCLESLGQYFREEGNCPHLSDCECGMATYYPPGERQDYCDQIRPELDDRPVQAAKRRDRRLELAREWGKRQR